VLGREVLIRHNLVTCSSTSEYNLPAYDAGMNRLASFPLRALNRLGLPHPDDESGQGMVEYAFILVMIAAVVIVTLIIVGNQTKNLWTDITSGLSRGG
jgi:pilus assembly protein Flp/PilA